VKPATAAELEMEAQWAELSATTNFDFEAGNRNDEDAMDAVRVTDEDMACTATLRAFLASLILASKFTQDKCYLNRAWAKLSGLPATEIGRCEHALGNALDWRLWVGKTTVTPPAPSPTHSCATITRSKSGVL
ncbi:hypothetical protein DFH07DRAFT_754236, partial [Mycena maculata]